MDNKPKAFLSYSHSDKDVASKIAERLRIGGIEVWFDRWEILAGDSLVQKIFAEGLSGADAFLILISKHSINSNWVRQELDVALIKRIEGITRIIPLILENVQLPEHLRPLRWVDMSTNFEGAIREIQMAIFQVHEKPPVGQPPTFVKNKNISVGGLSLLASAMGSFFANTGKHEFGSEEEISAKELKEKLDFSVEETDDAIDELENLGLVETRNYFGTHPFSHGDVIPTYALFIHFKGHGLTYDPDNDIKIIASTIAAKKQIDGSGLADSTDLSPLRINRAVAYLKDYGVADVHEYMGTAPYDFGNVWATGATRRFVAEHCK